MKKVIVAGIFSIIIIFTAVAASADSLSTHKVIRISMRVVSKAEIGNDSGTVVKRTVEEVDEKPVFDVVYRGLGYR